MVVDGAWGMSKVGILEKVNVDVMGWPGMMLLRREKYNKTVTLPNEIKKKRKKEKYVYIHTIQYHVHEKWHKSRVHCE
jgi:hypothetical protein